MTPDVVEVYQCCGAVMRPQRFVSKPMSCVVVIGELVSRRNHCALDRTDSRFDRSWRHDSAIYVQSKMALTPILLIRNQLASTFNNLDLEWS